MPPAQGRKPPGVGATVWKSLQGRRASAGWRRAPRAHSALGPALLASAPSPGPEPPGALPTTPGSVGTAGVGGGHQGQVQRLWPEGQCCISIKAKHAPAWPIPDGWLPRPVGFLLLSAPTLATLGRIYFLLNVRGEKPHTTGPEPGGHGSASGLKFRHLCFHTHWAWHTCQVR